MLVRSLSLFIALLEFSVVGADQLYDLLQGIEFFNKTGVVFSTDDFLALTVTSIYNEGYSYRGSFAGWNVHGVPYTFKMDSPLVSALSDWDIVGNDIKSLNAASESACRRACDQLNGVMNICGGYVYAYNDPAAPATCWLKSVWTILPVKKTCTNCTVLSCASCRPRCLPDPTAGPVRVSAPPLGVRSAVPLGSLGGGTVELRGDGRFGDFGSSFNTGPSDNGFTKWEIDGAFLGYSVGGPSSPFAATAMRTHPPVGVPAASNLTYSAAYPVAKWTANRPLVQNAASVSVDVFAFSSFVPHSPVDSNVPAITVCLAVANPTASPSNVSLFFNLPNVFNGSFRFLETSNVSGLSLNSGSPRGSLSFLGRRGGDTTVTGRTGVSPADNWHQFVADGGIFKGNFVSGGSNGAVALTKTFGPNQNSTLCGVLSWYFPVKQWARSGVHIGNFYTNNFESTSAIASIMLDRSSTLLSFARAYHAIFSPFDSTVASFMLNTASVFGKTTIFIEDGRFRAFESFSCAQVDPPHIHGYRALAYAMLFPSLEVQSIDLQAKDQNADGSIFENFGCGCGPCGDQKEFSLDVVSAPHLEGSGPIFLIDNYLNWKWHGNTTRLNNMYPHVKRAVVFIIKNARSRGYNLTTDMVNTFDEHGVIGNVNAYNAFLYLTGLAAAGRLAAVMNDTELLTYIRDAITDGRRAVTQMLWTGTYFRSFWCEELKNQQLPIVQGDTVYGLVWAYNLQLESDVGIDPLWIKSHLDVEYVRNWTPYGIRFWSGRDSSFNYHCNGGAAQREDSGFQQGFQDHDTWEAHSIDHGLMRIYLGMPGGMDIFSLVMNKYTDVYADAWDVRDLSSTYSDLMGTNASRPTCNSHYSRQLIMYSIFIAAPGAHYTAGMDGAPGVLTINPPENSPLTVEFPIVTPGGFGIFKIVPPSVTAESHRAIRLHYTLTCLHGELAFASVSFREQVVGTDVLLSHGATSVYHGIV